MVYRLSIISNEVEDFIREIKIDAEATFYDLHQAILSSCHYAEQYVPTFFFICNQEWEQEQEILLEDMGTSRSDEDLYLMKKDTAQRAVGRRETNAWSMFSTRWTTACFSLS